MSYAATVLSSHKCKIRHLQLQFLQLSFTLSAKSRIRLESVFAVKLHNVDITLLRIFATVVDSGGITAAQFALGLDKSTVSRRVKELEGRLGQSLCLRGRSGFHLTQAGEKVCLYAKQLFLAIDDFESNCDSLRNQLSGNIEIAMTDSMTTDPTCPLAPSIRSFMTKYRSVNVTVSTIQTSFIESEILSGKYHVGILPQKHKRDENISYFYLYDEISNVYCSYNSRPFLKAAYGRDDLRSEEFVNMSYPEWLRMTELLGNSWNTYPMPTVARSVEAAVLMILSGRFVGFLPRHIGKFWVDDGRMKAVLPEETTVKTPIYAAVRKSSYSNQIIREFMKEIGVELNFQ